MRAYQAPHKRQAESKVVTEYGRYHEVELHGPESMLKDCPFEHTACPDEAQAWIISAPLRSREDLVEALVEWFAEALSQDTAAHAEASLVFPADLTKQERACLHKQAERIGLSSQSEGMVDHRRLALRSKAVPAQASARASHRGVKQVWQWCQEEGGALWNVSQGELQTMLQSGTLSPEVQEIVTRKSLRELLTEALHARSSDQALALLAEEPRLATTKDAQGDFPIHQAAAQDMPAVAARLLQRPGVALQQSGQRLTALDVAHRHRHASMAALLEAAGVKPRPALQQRGTAKGFLTASAAKREAQMEAPPGLG